MPRDREGWIWGYLSLGVYGSGFMRDTEVLLRVDMRASSVV